MKAPQDVQSSVLSVLNHFAEAYAARDLGKVRSLFVQDSDLVLYGSGADEKRLGVAEVEVQAAIDRLAQHRTVVCIAHRLSTLSSMDQIIVLSEGQIVEQGGFQELLQRGGIFAGMAAGQGIFPTAAEAKRT